MKHHIAFALFLLASLSAAAARPVQEPSIVVSNNVLSITNISAGGSVAVFGAAQHVGTTVHLKRWQRLLTDTDSDGRVDWDLGTETPLDTLWVAVDVSTGGVAAVAPTESRFQRIEFPAEALRKGQDDKIEQFVAGRKMIDLLVVRPRVGAWAGFAADGHASDGDQQQNGQSAVVFAQARALDGRAPAPRHLTPRDVVVAVDLRKLEYYMTEVGQ